MTLAEGPRGMHLMSIDQQRLARRRNLRALLHPRHIAFVGGRQMARSIAMSRSAGFAGDLWTVNPRYDAIGGIACVDAVDKLPRAPDAAFIALAPERSIAVVSELARIGARGAVVHAAGFGELGGEFRRLEHQLAEAAGDMAIIGPNAMGVINNFDGVAIWPDQNDIEAVHGPGVALISQSGAILFGITNAERAYPMGYAVSVGNQAVIDAADVIEAVLDDGRVRAVGLYLEGLTDGVALGEALARANRQEVPVVLLRGGGTPAAAARSLSHTGNLAVSNDFWQALIDRYALVAVRSPKQLVETTKLLAVTGVPAGPRVFLTTYSGAACTLVAEQAPERGLELPPVSPVNHERVRATLPANIAISNPFDLNLPWESKSAVSLTDSDSIATCLIQVSEGEADTLVFMLDIPRRGRGDESWAPTIESMIQVAAHTGLPCVVASIMPEGLEAHHRQHLIDHGVAPLMGMTDCLDALASAAAYQCARESLRQAAGEPQPLLGPLPAGARTMHDEWMSKQALAPYGLRTPVGWAGPVAQAPEAARRIGFPVAVKALSDRLAHKHVFGGVRLNLCSPAEVADATARIAADLTRHGADVVLTKVLVEAMASDPLCELIIGVKRHAELGAALLIGRGGVAVEDTRDYALVLLPATRHALETALARVEPNLSPAAFANVVSAMRAVAEFAVANAHRLAELDVNPLLVGADDSVVAVDALLVTGGQADNAQ